MMKGVSLTLPKRFRVVAKGSTGKLGLRRPAQVGNARFLRFLALTCVTITALFTAYPTVAVGRPSDAPFPRGGHEFDLFSTSDRHRSSPPTADKPKRTDNRIRDHYIVVFNDSVNSPDVLARKQTRQRDGRLGFTYGSAINGYSATLSPTAVKAIRRDPRVKYVQPDRKVEAFSANTGLHRIHTEPSEISSEWVNVDVAVIDTGVSSHFRYNRFKHADCVPAGEDPVGEGSLANCKDDTGTDGNGHGTHVAGIIGAAGLGVAPHARLWGVRVLNNFGEGSQAWVVAGIDWVTEHAEAIEVANMSLGGYGPSPAMDEAITASVDAGVVYAVAAGNADFDSKFYHPANHSDVITASALADYDGAPGAEANPLKPTGENRCQEEQNSEGVHYGLDDTLASFSNWGEDVDVAAPGVCILSTLPGNEFGYASGTSMASPHVAGAAARLASESNPEDRDDVEAIRKALIGGGSLDYSDGSGDFDAEPLLHIGSPKLTATPSGVEDGHDQTVTFRGMVNPGDSETTYFFEYGPDTSYGYTTSSGSLASTAQATSVSQPASGLKAGEKYHVRLVATNSSGTVASTDRTVRLSRWVPQQPALKQIDGTALVDVSCASESECVSVGYEKVPLPPFYIEAVPVIEHWSNGEWHVQQLSYPVADDRFNAVGCSATNFCMAVGERYTVGEGYVPMARYWTGEEWLSANPPIPPDAGDWIPGQYRVIMSAVDCVSSTQCVAAGYYWREGGDIAAVVARWEGEGWSLEDLPEVPDEEDGRLYGVSCISASACWAVGASGHPSVPKPLILMWNGSSWSFQEAPELPGEVVEQLDDVSCTQGDTCMAIGSTHDPADPFWLHKPFALALESGDWSVTPAGARTTSDVTCMSDGSCLAVGTQREIEWDDEIEQEVESYEPVAEFWNGVTWSDVYTGRPPFGASEHSRLEGVSCQSTTCVAVGHIFDAFYPYAIQLSLGKPSVSTRPATEIGSDTATLVGLVNPAGHDTTYHFEYGKTASYGTNVPIVPGEVVASFSDQEVTTAIGGLSPGITYRYRVAATNAEGTSYSDDRTFTIPVPHTPRFESETQVSTALDGGLITDHVFDRGPEAPKFVCTEGSIEGTLPKLVSKPTTTIKVVPSYSGCTGPGGAAVTVEMNSCAYALDIDNAGPPYTGSASIACAEEGDAIVLKAELFGDPLCDVSYPPQNLGLVQYQVVGEGKTNGIVAEIDGEGVDSARVGSGFCGAASEEAGTFGGELELKGVNSKETQVGVYVNGRESVGLFLSGEESEEESQQPEFDAEQVPTVLVGKGIKHVFDTGFEFSCGDVAQVAGNMAASSNILDLDTSYSGCTGPGGAAVTVEMNSCAYALDIDNAGPPYTGSASIACAEEGDAIVLKAELFGNPLCDVSLPSQSLGEVGYETTGEGNARRVVAEIEAEGLSYARTGSEVCGSASGEDGSFSGGIALEAFPSDP